MSKVRKLLTVSRRMLMVLVMCSACAIPVSSASAAPPSAPAVILTSVSGIGPTIATLQAQINPDGVDTSYRFEYGPTTSYGGTVPIGGADIGSSSENVSVRQSLEGLLPNMTYHYRVVATNSLGVVPSEDETFSTFGIQSFQASAINADGSADVQAGSHPYEITTEFKLSVNENASAEVTPAGSPKDIAVELPPGMIGDSNAIPRCPDSMLVGNELGGSRCPQNTQVGLLALRIGSSNFVFPLYNLVPPAGVPAQFGIFALLFPVTMEASVRTGGNYGITVSLDNLSELPPITGTSLTLWGVPADPSHDPYRGSCLSEEGVSTGDCPSEGSLTPFITLPTECGSPLTIALQVDSWAQPGDFAAARASTDNAAGAPLDVTGCEKIDFDPTISVRTETTSADTPTGLTIDMALPQSQAGSIATASLREATVVLPEGMSVNPAVADGLGACTEAQIMLADASQSQCPESSKIGSAEVHTSLLTEPMTGSVYLAEPDENPFGALLAAYMVVEGDGVTLKLPLQLIANPSTGQISVRLTGIPELPFTDFEISLHGGPRAILASPDRCGTFATGTQLTPYSAPYSGPPSTPSSSFVIETGCGGNFAPSFVAGSTVAAAARDTSFTLQLNRADGQQHIQGLTAAMPPGVLANLGSVPACGSAQAATGTCGSASRIGTATIAAGAGSHPFYLSGSISLTGPYRGAPFGLSIALPTLIGPFDLGAIVLRAQVSLASNDLHLVIASDPLPQIIDGIPLRLRTVALTINRPGFLFNPSGCAAQQVSAIVESAEGASASLHTPFHVSGCAGLSFRPKLTASTQAEAGRTGDGAGIEVKVALSTHNGANIRSLTVNLGGQLRPRLTTIQRACRETVYLSNRAVCPIGSQVGQATIATSVLGSSLTGAIYLVFRGGTSNPDLAMVLQGGGVSVELEGALTVSRTGSLGATFSDLPDVPLQTFILGLSRGSHSLLGAISSPCSKSPSMSYAIVAHSGAKAKGTTKVAVDGCRKSPASKLTPRPARRAITHTRTVTSSAHM